MATGEIYNATLWCLPDKFYVTTDVTPDQLLTIDRTTYSIETVSTHHTSLANLVGSGGSRRPICGLLGIIQLVSGPHLVVANRKVKVGHITTENHAIWQLVESDVIPFSRSELHLSAGQVKLLHKQRQMVKELLQTPMFYFSYTYDLTNSQQRLASFHYAVQNRNKNSFNSIQKNHFRAPSNSISTLHSKFAWNYNILRPFLAKVDHLSYCVAIIHGAVFIQHCSINGKHFRWSLISRRSTKRAGTRFFRRGCDNNGNVANFVETEQICEHGEYGLTSFVQTRGSIPMYWTQEPDPFIYMPTPEILVGLDHTAAFAAHFREQIQYYGDQVIVNLINHSKAEGVLQRAFQSLSKEAGIKEIHYESFDFHKECSKLQWGNLKLLIARLRPFLEQFDYFHKSSLEQPMPSTTATFPSIVTQSGVFRTNCMDCLDRTNVVQSMLANENLNRVLFKFGVLKDVIETTESHPEFQRLFRGIWADHANLLAMQYAGSGALKTDFTRTGKRTYAGLLEDLRNALMRFFKNNFQDGFRQDSIDLFLGTTKVPILVEDYLTTYLPAEANYQRKLYAQAQANGPGTFHQQIQNIQQLQNIKPINNVETVQNNNSQLLGRSTLLRKDFSIASVQAQHNQDISTIGASLSPNQGVGQLNSPLNKNRVSNGVTSETWRSETFAKILISFWLESYTNRSPEVNLNAVSSSPTSYSTPLPSQELLRCIRMFIKHAHYFSNSCREGGPFIPNSLRFTPGAADLFSINGGIGCSTENNALHSGSNNKTLFAFLSLCIDHWPLDASFRLVLETWLSYIQPWRYTQMQNIKGNVNKNDPNEPIDSSKWSTFVDENIMFYTNILGKLLSNRFTRLDMSSHKNSYMLYRIAKVYSQDNLVGIISYASSMQGGRSIFQNLSNASPRRIPSFNLTTTEEHSSTNSTRNISNASAFSATGSGITSNPVMLLGLDFKQLVTALIQILVEAKLAAVRTRKIAENLNRSQTEKEKSIGFPSKFVAFIADVLGMRNNTRPSTPGSSGMDPAEKIESDKTIGYIEFCIEKFSTLFELETTLEKLNLNVQDSNLISEDKTNNDAPIVSPIEEIAVNGLSPIQRRDILLKKVKVYSKYDGNPDRIPVRSDEFQFLVKILLFLSYQIDKKWRLTIEKWYNKKPGFAYAVFRQICTAPCIYRSSGNEFFEDSSMPIDNKLPDDSFCGSLKRFDPSNKRRLPARIVLRPLASYKILFYIFIAYVILSLWQRSFVSSLVVLSLLYLLWLVAKAAVEYVCEVKTDEHKDNLVDMTLESTLLSPDNSY